MSPARSTNCRAIYDPLFWLLQLHGARGVASITRPFGQIRIGSIGRASRGASGGRVERGSWSRSMTVPVLRRLRRATALKFMADQWIAIFDGQGGDKALERFGEIHGIPAVGSSASKSKSKATCSRRER